MAILAVVVAGALIIATHAAVNLEHRVAAAALNRQRAFAASEHGLWTSIADWDAANTALEPGAATRRIIHAAGDSAAVTTVRLNDQLYWLVADASVGNGSLRARRRTGTNVRSVSDSTGTRVVQVSRSWVEVH